MDPLDMTMREFLMALFENRGANDDDWINVRGDVYPWKRIVAAAARGECEVSRVGRRLMMQRSELSRWLARHRIESRPKKVKPEPDAKPKGKYADVVERMLTRRQSEVISESVQRALAKNGIAASPPTVAKKKKKRSSARSPARR